MLVIFSGLKFAIKLNLRGFVISKIGKIYLESETCVNFYTRIL